MALILLLPDVIVVVVVVVGIVVDVGAIFYLNFGYIQLVIRLFWPMAITKPIFNGIEF